MWDEGKRVRRILQMPSVAYVCTNDDEICYLFAYVWTRLIKDRGFQLVFPSFLLFHECGYPRMQEMGSPSGYLP